MHLETLQVFCDLVETGSFSAAAAQNFITQSAVSQQVRRLEARFDRPLIERTKGNVQPTPAGQLLYQASKDITQRYRDLASRCRASASVVSGSVRLATVHSVGLYELSEPLKKFLKAYPQVQRPPRVQPLDQDLRGRAHRAASTSASSPIRGAGRRSR